MIEIKNLLKNAPGVIDIPSYDPKTIKPGIAHIGVGNFHRAHEAFYNHLFLNTKKRNDWGIVGIGITASGRSMAEKFKRQDNLYTLTEYGPSEQFKVTVIGAIVRFIAARENQESTIEQLASPEIKIISLTITEGGYHTDSKGHFHLNQKDLQHDLQNPLKPSTAFGYVTAALYRRFKRGTGPVTILSCDNLRHNGDITRQAFVSFASARNPLLGDWISKNVSFPNAMVDRITPATTASDIYRLNQQSGVKDAIPVFAEDFTQWIIEDNFCAGRPEWELAGVKFTNDVTPYETLKLRLLNASHSMLAYPAFLAGYRKVDEAMENHTLRQYLLDFMNLDVSPVLEPPADVDLGLYKDQLMERFSNTAVSDQLSRLCHHGGAKIPVFLLPTLLEMFDRSMDIRRIAYLIAAYAHYLAASKDDVGNDYEISAPAITAGDWKMIKDHNPEKFLRISPLRQAKLFENTAFLNTYLEFRQLINQKGTIATLLKLVSSSPPRLTRTST